MSEGLEQPVVSLTLADAITIFGGVALFARWLLITSLGRKALVGSRPRRNRMAPYMPIIPFVIWFLGTALLQPIVLSLAGHPQGWRLAFLNNVIFCVGALAAVVVILVVAKASFARGLKGFGLKPKMILKDLAYGFVDLLAVWPLVAAMIVVTMAIGKVVWGRDFQMPQHQELELMTTFTRLPLQVLIVLLAVVVAPVVEEMLFRGLFQTMIRSYLEQPWLAVLIASILFAVVHQDPEHWPALFMLAMGLGYAYEKSGSLLRPIFMHALFNGVTIVTVLLEQAA